MGAGGSGGLRSSFHLNNICRSSNFTPASAKETPVRVIMPTITANSANFIVFITITSLIFHYAGGFFARRPTRP